MKMIIFAHVQKAAVAPNEDVVVAEREDQFVDGGVAEYDSDGWDGEGEESGHDGFEGFDHLVEAVAGVGLAPRDVEAVAKEFAVSDGDEGRAAIDGLGVDLGESREEKVNERWAEPVLVIVTDQCQDKEAAAFLLSAHGLRER